MDFVRTFPRTWLLDRVNKSLSFQRLTCTRISRGQAWMMLLTRVMTQSTTQTVGIARVKGIMQWIRKTKPG